MRLYDWLTNRDHVMVQGNLITDRYVFVDTATPLGYGMRVPDGDGVFRISASKAPERREESLKPNLLQKMYSRAGKGTGWSEIVFSDWRAGEGENTIGSLAGVPVAVRSEWLSRLPAEYVLEGREPHKPFRIVHLSTTSHQKGAKARNRTVCGLVAPVQMSQVTEVHWAITASLAGPDGKPRAGLLAG